MLGDKYDTKNVYCEVSGRKDEKFINQLTQKNLQCCVFNIGY